MCPIYETKDFGDPSYDLVWFKGYDWESEVFVDNKVFVITGATSGIGKALALDIAQNGKAVVIIARDADRGSAALKKIALTTQNPNLDLQLCN